MQHDSIDNFTRICLGYSRFGNLYDLSNPQLSRYDNRGLLPAWRSGSSNSNYTRSQSFSCYLSSCWSRLSCRFSDWSSLHEREDSNTLVWYFGDDFLPFYHAHDYGSGKPWALRDQTNSGRSSFLI